jgi:Tol biopolymer transport system component
VEPTDLNWQGDPAWSPGGDQIAFVAAQEPGGSSGPRPLLFVVRPDGSGLADITPLQLRGQYVSLPTWSPDGSELALAANDAIWIVSADGREARKVMDMSGSDPGPPGLDWSPDGRMLAYSGNGEVGITNVVGTAVTQLTDHPGADYQPSWSPDGEWLVFVSDRGFRLGLYVMAADGSSVRPLTEGDDVADEFPAWSPTE